MCGIKSMRIQSPRIECSGIAATAISWRFYWTRRVAMLGMGDSVASAKPSPFVGSTEAAPSRSAASLC